MINSAALIGALATVLAALAPGSWLDRATPANWNVAGAPLPPRPGPPDAELAAGARCASLVRPPSTPEDRAATGRGWTLVGPYQRYGATSFVMVAAAADGMCRPEGFQGFVFVGGVYAGRIAPHDMEPRTDGSPNALGPTIFLADEFQVDFMRYRASDALCCPHGVSSVTYRVTRANGVPLLVPVSVETRPTSSE